MTPSSDYKTEPDAFITIRPPETQLHPEPTPDTGAPPSFESSQFAVIYRRQRKTNSLKITRTPSRFIHLPHAFEFAGWGEVRRVVLSEEDVAVGQSSLESLKRRRVLGQFTASALAGNDVLGSVFYAFPAVVEQGGVFSPISLTIATFILFLWRPIMEELASALPINGAPYTYLLNASSKPLALMAATLLLLDFVSTSVVSAATASAQLGSEVDLPFPSWIIAAMILFLFVVVSLSGLRESARIALTVFSIHAITMCILIIIAANRWREMGNSQLRANWNEGLLKGGTSPRAIIRQIYNGFCLGMLGLTGFECVPSYVSRIKEGQYPNVLRNLHIPAMVLNGLLMLLVLALVPLDVILSEASVLSALGFRAAGPWLRILITVDAVIVLCGTVLTGIFSAGELLAQLAEDRVVPSLFLKTLPFTRAPYMSILTFAGLCALLFASAGGQLQVVSLMFSLVWLTVMSLFPLSLLLLKYNRHRLKREPRASLFVIVLALLIVCVGIAGNIAINPRTFGYFSAYFIGITFFFFLTQHKSSLLKCLYWTIDQYLSLQNWRWTNHWGASLVNAIARTRRQPVCILTKGDEINQLVRMVMYVRKNEETSNLKVVHFYDQEKGIPSELEANIKILDEAFPEISIDLVLVEGTFEPKAVAAVAHNLEIPTSLMFMTCPSSDFPHQIAEFGTRIISL
ncbi:hypothetical protein AGABI1DRAFT_75891 [Agaricus bisporus var. burnettii JB137-S8]|nr:uncharacterized protein AGABI1DRAFT_75891 [Agaricus bisporus var. burnettii JB137-S8]EKM78341.1 hypothetical protein AGABI1DRAFT_75891 [Agaricus bisporus var. burnettii JB137-S8]